MSYSLIKMMNKMQIRGDVFRTREYPVSPRKYPAMELGGGGEVGCSGEYLSSGYFESFACQF